MRTRLILLAVCLCAGAWAVHPIVDGVPFVEGQGLALRVTPMTQSDLVARSFVLLAIVAGTVVMGRAFGKLRWAEDRARHIDALLQGVRAIVPLGTEVRDAYGLIRGASGGLMQTRGYESAWIALLNPDGTFKTAVQNGWKTGFGELMERMKDGAFPACAQKAFSQPTPVVFRDTVSQCHDCHLQGRRYGRGALAMRIEAAGKLYGVR